MTELLRALAVLAEPPSAQGDALARVLEIDGTPAAADYTELFQLNLYPYASVYLGDEAMLGGEARDRIAGFWRAVGIPPPSEPDHLASLLGLYAALGASSMPAHAQRALLWEHLLSWLPPYLEKVTELAPPFYRAWAELLMRAITVEAEHSPSEELVPLHLREASSVVDPRVGGLVPFLDSLLAAVRSGMILVRRDLASAARELGLGLRLGERRVALEVLMAQDAKGVLGWLALEADRWSTRHRQLPEVFAPVAEMWAARAERTAALLAELSVHTEGDIGEMATGDRAAARVV